MSDPQTSTVLYKILTENEYSDLPTTPEASGEILYPGTALDLQDGFIHTSTSTQLLLTLKRFFVDAQHVWLLAIPRTEKVEKTLKFDPASTGELFGHLYAPFDLNKDVTSRHLVKRKDDGEWDLGVLEY